MKKILLLLVVMIISISFAAHALASANDPLLGWVREPGTTVTTGPYSKVGNSYSFSLMIPWAWDIISFGNAGPLAAAEEMNISKIQHVEKTVFTFLLLKVNTTSVYGS